MKTKYFLLINDSKIKYLYKIDYIESSIANVLIAVDVNLFLSDGWFNFGRLSRGITLIDLLYSEDNMTKDGYKEISREEALKVIKEIMEE